MSVATSTLTRPLAEAFDRREALLLRSIRVQRRDANPPVGQPPSEAIRENLRAHEDDRRFVGLAQEIGQPLDLVAGRGDHVRFVRDGGGQAASASNLHQLRIAHDLRRRSRHFIRHRRREQQRLTRRRAASRRCAGRRARSPCRACDRLRRGRALRPSRSSRRCC